MKKILSFLSVFAVFLLMAFPVLAVKPDTNLAAAQKVDWNLSGAVMPLPWGQHDIIGSDTSSKLIVNQPNGSTEVAITGVMNGLEPNTTYTVYPSNAWSSSTVWNVQGSWIINVEYLGVDYPENMVLTQSGSSITGVSLALVTPPGGSPWTIDSGSVVGTSVTINGHYNSNPGMTIQMTGTIAPDGSMSGSWHDVTGGSRTGTWESTSGAATSQTVGNGYPGLFGGLQTFTFTTDEFGNGSWHINLRDTDFAGPGTYTMSIWVNSPYPATILISNNFTVVVN